MFLLNRTPILAVVAIVALVVSGCGGGGSASTILATPNGDEQPENSAQVLQDDWQQFSEGNPTLDLSQNDVVEIHAQTSANILSDGEPVENEFGGGWLVTGLEGEYHLRDGSWHPGSRYEPVEPGEPEHVLSLAPQRNDNLLIDITKLPDEIEVTTNPVLEHNGITLIAISVSGEIEEDDFTESFQEDHYWGYGKWSLFSTYEVECEDWGVGTCNELHDEVDYRFESSGHWTAENPRGVGSASWSGIMFGRDVAQYDPGSTGQVLGEARIDINDLASPHVDVLFTGITDLATGASRSDMEWSALTIENGAFNHQTPDDRVTISGAFYGPSHQEVGGVFDRNGIAGAFGATREEQSQ